MESTPHTKRVGFQFTKLVAERKWLGLASSLN